MAIAYSFIITWTYFTIYVSIFLVVSVICANRVRCDYQEYKKQTNIDIEEQQHRPAKEWSKKGLFKKWYRLLWKKKKVYLPLIPHFFDQATDCGVIFQYWYLRNEENIGINTWYLFIVSIGIIALHRIVSSAAIYKLTNNKWFILYQIFDVLMIRCIWTNYELDTNEPSNSQRYLQLLEATFESAPQILISTAFLVKASSDNVSAIVILSLITSFWSLSARVSSDDKSMFKNEWKKLRFKRKYPCINLKYIIRVFLWRFLEISSRIVLLCLVWINLGGMSIFIILGAELLYLMIICFGLGTVDMMGNMIYLCYANAHKNTEEWAKTMTYTFWSYRAISSWILLILVSIFATTEFDLWKVQNYGNRHSQTFIDQTGLALFIYTWIATPIWQWVGAVIVFDFKNLSSTARDVAQLVQDNKWNDVLELIKFGARFHAEETLTTICSTKYNKNDELLFTLIKQICLAQIEEEDKVNTAFVTACKNNELNTAKYLFKNEKINVNEKDDNGRSVLFYVAATNNVQITRMLIKEYGADCSHTNQDKDGLSVLQYMFENSVDPNSKILRYLLDDGGFDRDQALTFGCHYNHGVIMEYLLADKQLNVNDSIDGGRTPLFYFAAHGNLRIVTMLIQHDADISITDNDGLSVLDFILEQNEKIGSRLKPVVRCLIDNGFDTKQALHISCKRNAGQLIKILLEEYEMNVNYVDDDGHTPLFYFAANNNVGVVRFLVNENNAKCNVKDKNGLSVLEYMFNRNKERDSQNIVIEQKKRRAIIKCLVENGKFDKQTALDICCNKNRFESETIKYLLNQPDDDDDDKNNNQINAQRPDEEGRTPLFYAAAYNNIEIVKLLANKHKADVNIKDNDGSSILHYMLEHNKIDATQRTENEEKQNMKVMEKIIKYLIEEMDFDIEVANKNGDTVYKIIKSMKHTTKIEQYLRRTLIQISKKRGEKVADLEDNDNDDAKLSDIEQEEKYFEQEQEQENLEELDDHKYNDPYEEELEVEDEKAFDQDPRPKLLNTTTDNKKNNKLQNTESSWMTNQNVNETPIMTATFKIFKMSIAFLLIGVDVVALVINQHNDCDTSIINDNTIDMDVSHWMLSGSIIHGTTMLCSACTLFYYLFARGFSFDRILRKVPNPSLGVFIIFIIFIYFVLSWVIIGLILYSDMNYDIVANKQCSGIVLGWCIVKIVEIVSVILFLFYANTHF